MASQIELTRDKIKHAIDTEYAYSFPEFIRQLRLIIGKSRRRVASEVGMSYDKLFRLEYGNFRVFYKKRIASLSHYYALEKGLLERKCFAYLDRKKFEVSK